MKRLIHKLEQENPYVAKNIFRSVENVNLNTVIGYKKDGVRHHFLDTYEDAGKRKRNKKPDTAAGDKQKRYPVLFMYLQDPRRDRLFCVS